MEGKGELHKVLEIACELSAHAEKRSLRPELHKALSYHQNRPIFFTHPRALWAPCDTAPPRAWTMSRSFVLSPALPQIALASAWFEINASACDPAFTSFLLPCLLLISALCPLLASQEETSLKKFTMSKSGCKERCSRN